MNKNQKDQLRDLQQIAQGNGGHCLSTNYVDQKTELLFECKRGHLFSRSSKSIKHSGTWCTDCEKIQELAYMQELAESKGGKCLSFVYFDNLTELEFECKRGHLFPKIPRYIKRGDWCRRCASIENTMNQRGTIEEMQVFASSIGWRCLSTVYYNNVTNLLWQCPNEGHEPTSRTASNAKQNGLSCEECRKEMIFQELSELAQIKGGKCLSNRYHESKEQMLFRCKEGHEFWKTPYKIKNFNQWCDTCEPIHIMESRKEVFEQVQEIAEGKGGRCLSVHYEGWDTLLNFQCHNGHIFPKLSGDIRRNLWCLDCRKEEYLAEIQQIAKELGGNCLSVTYIDLDTPLLFTCKNGHQFTKKPESVKYRGSWCEECRLEDFLQEFRGIAQQHGGICLSDSYNGLDKEMSFKCKNGHEFTQTGLNIKHNDSWCEECKNDIRHDEIQQLGDYLGWTYIGQRDEDGKNHYFWRCVNGHEFSKNLYSFGNHETYCIPCKNEEELARMQEFARERGGICLSDHFLNLEYPLSFRCKDGHEFENIAKNVKYLASWCEQCQKLEKLREIQVIALNKGGKCLSGWMDTFEDVLDFECAKGHTWSTFAKYVRSQDNWCPECADEGYVNERKCRYIFEQVFKCSFSKNRTFLSTKYELDGYNAELKIAFEYNGLQHYKFFERYHGTIERFFDQLKRDRSKIEECKERGVSLIVIPYKIKKDLAKIKFIVNELHKEGIQFDVDVENLSFNAFYEQE